MHRTTLAAVAVGLLAACASRAGDNLVRDPGFEQYHYDEGLGYYVPNPRTAVWREITFGRASVRFDASSWSAPEDMTAERPLGFTPGARGFEGYGADENGGVLIFEQDIVNPQAFADAERYEAWFWLGGAGNDNDPGADLKDEEGAWEIWFYTTGNTAAWTESNALEYHRTRRTFSAAPGSFERVCGYGFIPDNQLGIQT